MLRVLRVGSRRGSVSFDHRGKGFIPDPCGTYSSMEGVRNRKPGLIKVIGTKIGILFKLKVNALLKDPTMIFCLHIIRLQEI